MTSTHGINALQEIVAFGSHENVYQRLVSHWRSERTSALADTLASFVRIHLSCSRLCDRPLPQPYAVTLSRMLRDELLSARCFEKAGALLDSGEISEEVWRARSLLQLIADVHAQHRLFDTAVPTKVQGAKRQKTAAGQHAGSLHQLLREALLPTEAASAPEVRADRGRAGRAHRGGYVATSGPRLLHSRHLELQSRWLLLLGTVLERHPACIPPLLRTEFASGLVALLPSTGSRATWSSKLELPCTFRPGLRTCNLSECPPVTRPP